MKYDVCVIGGGGHIGLPLSVAFAAAGQKVIIQDINAEVLKLIDAGQVPFKEDGAEEKLQKTIGKTLFTSTNPEVIRESSVVVVVIGTPVDEHLNPKYHVMKKFLTRRSPIFAMIS